MRIDRSHRPRRGVRLLAALLTAALGFAPMRTDGQVEDVDDIAAPAQPSSWQWPLDPVPPVVRPFDPPSEAWDAAHRGVDLAGSTAQQVRAIGSGTVRFAGVIAGRGVVVVDHAGLRSTYEPVTALLPAGTAVGAGQVIGLLQAVGSHCSPDTCLHLGVRRGDAYLDPLSLLGRLTVRLKPIDGLVYPPPHVLRLGGEPAGRPP